LGRPPVDFYDIGERLTMGRHSYSRPRVRWYYGDVASVHIGNFASVADDVVITVGGAHPTDWVSTFPFRAQLGEPGAFLDGMPKPERDVVIGNDVWIGRGARILGGVHIGDGAVVGAYSVVGSDVRPYAVVVGNPAREIRRRFSDEQIEGLLRIRWWGWPDDEVREAIPILSSNSIDEFLDRYDPSPRASLANPVG
jgi:acetyltransferase-like isoleucine patch superfamily enzyme